MAPEGFNKQPEKKRSERGLEHDYSLYGEAKGEVAAGLVEAYRGVQTSIAEKRESLKRGNERAIEEKDPERYKLFVKVGTLLEQEIDELEAKKSELEARIKDAGGTPEDHRIH